MPPDPFSKGYSFITPNITPDAETGRIASWTEQMFVDGFRKGRMIEGSPMPWGAFSRVNEVELKAIFRYLNSVAGVKKKIEKIVFKPGEKFPE